MSPVEIDGANMTLAAPRGSNDEDFFGRVRARGGRDLDEQPFIEVAWMPNYEDLQAMNAGKPLIVRIADERFPPLAMYTTGDDGKPNV